jgi:hypothetical protein
VFQRENQLAKETTRLELRDGAPVLNHGGEGAAVAWILKYEIEVIVIFDYFEKPGDEGLVDGFEKCEILCEFAAAVFFVKNLATYGLDCDRKEKTSVLALPEGAKFALLEQIHKAIFADSGIFGDVSHGAKKSAKSQKSPAIIVSLEKVADQYRDLKKLNASSFFHFPHWSRQQQANNSVRSE